MQPASNIHTKSQQMETIRCSKPGSLQLTNPPAAGSCDLAGEALAGKRWRCCYQCAIIVAIAADLNDAHASYFQYIYSTGRCQLK